jgi:glycolate oxidase FAD binding subunit
MTGSFGSLGVVLNATFKLYPLAETSRTVVVELPTATTARALVKGLDACQLTPTAVEIQMPPLRVLVRFESIAASVDKQSGQTVSLASDLGGRSSILQGHDEEREWEAHRGRPWSGTGAVVKVTLAPSDLPNIVGLITESMASDVDVSGRAGLGVLTDRLGGDESARAAAVKALRQRPAGTGGAVLLRASDELRREVGIWGPMGDAFPIMMKMKRAFDPDKILNPGGGPGGL